MMFIQEDAIKEKKEVKDFLKAKEKNARFENIFQNTPLDTSSVFIVFIYTCLELRYCNIFIVINRVFVCFLVIFYKRF